ncbi:MAG: N-acetyltransferase [Acidobacteriota bacterium]
MLARMMIRDARLDDIDAIQTLAVEAEMFTPDEAGFLGAQLRALHAGDPSGGRWLVVEDASAALIGSVYYAPEPFSDRMWNLYFIAVAPGQQRTGLGRRLMAHVEEALRAQGEETARTLIVETSSTPKYERARAFYRAIGYDEEARIRQFYGPEDDKVVFWKSLVDAPR